MLRCWLVAAGLAAGLFPCGQLAAAGRNELIPETTAVRHGLTRPWFTQAQIDVSRGRVHQRDVVLDDGTLFVQTDRAMLTAIHAETGQTLWVRQIGRPDQPNMPLGLNRDLAAVINGSRLYVVNRHNGELLYEVQINGAPGGGAAVSNKRAYVPMVSGLLMAYSLKPPSEPAKGFAKAAEEPPPGQAAGEQQRRNSLRLQQQQGTPLYCQSPGRALVQPLVTRQLDTEEYVVWPTDRGFVNIGRVKRQHEENFAILFQLRSNSLITTRPTYLPPDPNIVGDSGVVYATTIDGYVYAVLEKNGTTLWRYSTADPIVQPAAVVDERVYVAMETGGMYCLDAKTGDNLWAKTDNKDWFSPGITQFVAASKQRVYAADKLGRLLALSAATGARLDVVLPANSLTKVLNIDTDRLYLVTETGLVQCLRELEQPQPLLHNQNRKAAAVPSSAAKGPEEKHPKRAAAKDAAQEPAAEPAGDLPPQLEKKPAAQGEGAEDPFGAPAGGKQPATKGGAAKGDSKNLPKQGPGNAGKADGGGAPDDPFAPEPKGK